MLWELLPANLQVLDTVLANTESFTLTDGLPGVSFTISEGVTTVRITLTGRRKTDPAVALRINGADWTYTADLANEGAGKWFTVETDAYETETVLITDAYSVDHDLPSPGDTAEVGYLLGHLDGFLQIVDRIFLDTKRAVDQFTNLFDPDTCPEQFLNSFLHLLGWSLSGSTMDDPLVKRKVIRLAVAIYKAKGTRAGIVHLIRLLTGLESQVFGCWPEETFELGIAGTDNNTLFGYTDNTDVQALTPAYQGDDAYTELELERWSDSGITTIGTSGGDVSVLARSRYQGAQVEREIRSLQSIDWHSHPLVEILGVTHIDAPNDPIAGGTWQIRFAFTPITFDEEADPAWDAGADLYLEYSLNGGYTWHRATHVTGSHTDPTQIPRRDAEGTFIEYDGEIAQQGVDDVWTNIGAANVQIADAASSGGSECHEILWDSVAEGLALDRSEAGVKFRIVSVSRHFGWYGTGDCLGPVTLNNIPDGAEELPSDAWEAERTTRCGAEARPRNNMVLCTSRLGSSRLGPPQRLNGYIFHFEVYVFAASLTDEMRHFICQIVQWAKPVWSHFTLVLDEPTLAPNHWRLGTSQLGSTARA